MFYNNKIGSAYIHIPFCKSICSYCDFCKNYYNTKLVQKYILELKNEISSKYKGEALNTIYVGGGTPSALSLNELKQLFKVISIFKLSNDYEFTFECNYEDINEDMLILLKKNGVNRLSIGLQTMNKKFEKLLGRKIDENLMKNNVMLSKKYFDNINVDLMYGFSNETIEELKEDLNKFIKLDVNHISTYCLIVEDHTMLKIEKVKEQDSEVQSKMYYEIIKELSHNGFNHYEISNFAKKGYESRHNLTYWNNECYYGFGLGASGYTDNVRYTNTKSMNNYLDKKYIHEIEELDYDLTLEYEVILSLRKILGIDKKRFQSRFGHDFKELYNIDNLIKEQLLIEDDSNIFIPSNLLFVSNEIIVRVLDVKKTLE